MQSNTQLKSASVMEQKTIQKKRASLKSHTSRGIIGILILCFLTQSCQVMTLRGHHAFLSDKASYSGADLEMNVPTFPQFDLNLIVGAGKMDIANSSFNLSDEEIKDASKIRTSLGVGITYYFSQKRLQPFTSLEYNYIMGIASRKLKEDKEIGMNYNAFIPKLGLRYYLSNHIALNGSLGYQCGWTTDFEKQNHFISGLTPTVGITFVLYTKKN